MLLALEYMMPGNTKINENDRINPGVSGVAGFLSPLGSTLLERADRRAQWNRDSTEGRRGYQNEPQTFVLRYESTFGLPV